MPKLEKHAKDPFDQDSPFSGEAARLAYSDLSSRGQRGLTKWGRGGLPLLFPQSREIREQSTAQFTLSSRLLPHSLFNPFPSHPPKMSPIERLNRLLTTALDSISPDHPAHQQVKEVTFNPPQPKQSSKLTLILLAGPGHFLWP